MALGSSSRSNTLSRGASMVTLLWISAIATSLLARWSPAAGAAWQCLQAREVVSPVRLHRGRVRRAACRRNNRRIFADASETVARPASSSGWDVDLAALDQHSTERDVLLLRASHLPSLTALTRRRPPTAPGAIALADRSRLSASA